MLRTFALASVALIALGLTACDREVRIAKKDPAEPTEFRTLERLDCPETQGDLRRLSAAADGKTCSYAAKDQAEVELRLVATSGDESAALAPIETELRALIPQPATLKAPAPDSGLHVEGDDKSHIRLPGLSIDSDGDRAQIHVGGIHIDGEHDRANISISQKRGGEFNIQADDGNATIRQTRDNERGVRRSVIFATETPTAAGFRVAGYEARGPKAGPLVVAVVRSKGKGDTDYVFKDMKSLVARNAGR
ncbi:MAG: hypothetical protein J0I28_08445 [Caulobacterales bacterium]|nr:hypothetical protein [Caulobacterales bacterium]